MNALMPILKGLEAKFDFLTFLILSCPSAFCHRDDPTKSPLLDITEFRLLASIIIGTNCMFILNCPICGISVITEQNGLRYMIRTDKFG
jgi:hypothetical protein